MTVSSELERLRNLFHEGVIDEREFLEAKSAVLRNADAYAADVESTGWAEADPQPEYNPYDVSHSRYDVPTHSADDKTWGILIHLSQFAGYAIPLGGYLVPIVLWLVKRKDSRTIDEHGRVIINWLITQLILLAIAIPLCFVFIGIPLLFGILLAGVVFAIIGTVRAADGIVWRYPMSLDVL